MSVWLWGRTMSYLSNDSSASLSSVSPYLRQGCHTYTARIVSDILLTSMTHPIWATLPCGRSPQSDPHPTSVATVSNTLDQKHAYYLLIPNGALSAHVISLSAGLSFYRSCAINLSKERWQYYSVMWGDNDHPILFHCIHRKLTGSIKQNKRRTGWKEERKKEQKAERNKGREKGRKRERRGGREQMGMKRNRRKKELSAHVRRHFAGLCRMAHSRPTPNGILPSYVGSPHHIVRRTRHAARCTSLME